MLIRLSTLALLTSALPAFAGSVTQTNLVSNQAGQATFTDPNLQNAWGISYAPGGEFWVSDNADGLTTLYDTTGAVQSLVVTIPPPAGGKGPSAPTGQVYYAGNGFKISENGKSGPSQFMFVTEDGTISGWNFSVDANNAILAVDNSKSAAVYKGSALVPMKNGTSLLYVTNFFSGNVEVYDSTFTKVTEFRDSKLPKKFSPYNIAYLNGQIYVTYAVVDAQRHDSLPGAGFGAIETVSPTGAVTASYVHGQLNGPWGLAIAPSTWGPDAGKLLVGNFGDGEIAVFSTALKPHGVLKDKSGKPIAIDGLWGLIAGNGGSGGLTSDVYFSAGPNQEVNGLFGSLSWNQ